MKEIAFHVGMALDSQENSTMPAKKNSAIITDHPVVIRANKMAGYWKNADVLDVLKSK